MGRCIVRLGEWKLLQRAAVMLTGHHSRSGCPNGARRGSNRHRHCSLNPCSLPPGTCSTLCSVAQHSAVLRRSTAPCPSSLWRTSRSCEGDMAWICTLTAAWPLSDARAERDSACASSSTCHPRSEGGTEQGAWRPEGRPGRASSGSGSGHQGQSGGPGQARGRAIFPI